MYRGLSWLRLFVFGALGAGTLSLGRPAVAVCSTAQAPVTIATGGVVTINNDTTYCGRQIIVQNSGPLPTTVNIVAGGLVGEGVDVNVDDPQAVLVRDTSVVHITGGSAEGVVLAEEEATLTISGGIVARDVTFTGSARGDISGGSLGDDLELMDDTIVDLSGSNVGGFIELIQPTGTTRAWLRILGDNFHVNSAPAGDGDITPLEGDLDADLDSGDPLFALFTRNPGARITLATPSSPDTDADGVDDPFDNCPAVSNANQADYDGDTVGDRCDNPLASPGNDLAACSADLADLLAATADCGDGLDNDGDNLVDDAGGDPGCTSPTDASERDASAAKCDNALDDDNDGNVDYPGDPGCTGPNDNNEKPSCGLGFELALVLPLLLRARRRRR